ncbi:Bicyclomycin resistance protein [Rubrivivax sp. A210]|uniref:ABC transporter substrate-binding protein n=1 Tax=Rubrivivax sp. A210 TaxID=2772301 RepID=UPI00191982EB|nr:ABC transporter substrate-binding protein [Rubrivivax sp. A210]CAD5373261.1 Bicyclomycin resistance protein [Rubrivivax sp. A210]
MRRRQALALGAALALPGQAVRAAAADGGGPRKVLRLAFPVAETGFDPARISDLYSRTITPHIFEALYRYDHLARPILIKPLTAEALPEIADEFRSYTVRLKRGILFQDDAAFQGQPRELTAADYVYSFKRFADPATKSPGWATVEDFRILGLAEVRQRALANKQPFDYDAEVEGLRALDRYTLQIRIEKPRPRFTETLAASDLYGAVAREVVQHYGDRIAEHPVGTGPYRLAQWRRSSFIALERNPGYREVRWDAEPAPGDAEGQAIAARLKGQRLPLIDRVEVSIIEEAQPRWLSFLNGQIDLVAVPGEFVPAAMPGGKVAPHLARRGVRGQHVLRSDATLSYFNMEDPVVGGLAPAQVALRRAICLGVDIEREVRLAWRGMALPAQSIIVPHTSGYDARFKSSNGEYSPARAKALLDLYGYTDRDGDGWRERPDGSPLLIRYATQPDQNSRQLIELWQRNMLAIGIRMEFVAAKWPENLKAARAGKLQMWGLGSLADSSDGQSSLTRLYGPQAGQGNLARFRLPAFDAVFDKLTVLPDGPERMQLFEQAKRLQVAYAPYKVHVHRILADLQHPKVYGWRRPLFWQECWHMLDVLPPGPPAA